MNIRVIAIIFVVLFFALASGIWNYSVSGGIPLKEAYGNGKIQVVLNTAAGTVPHEVTIKNNGNGVIKVKKGDVLASSVSQDLVIVEDKKIASNSSENVKAYCIEPSQRAKEGTKLLPVNDTYSAVNRVISNSNPLDSQSAMKAQLQIWVIMSGGNLNPYTGEPVAVVETQHITWTQLRQDISNAKSDVMAMFKVREDEIKDLNQNPSQFMGIQTWIDGISNWIKGSLGI